MNIIKDNKGIAAIMIVVVLGVTTFILAFSASFLSIGELDMGYTAQKAGEASALADGCMEEALRQIRLDTGYIGETLNIVGNSCIIGVQTGGSNRTITVSAFVGDYSEKIEATITLSGTIITLNTWQELDT